jgi:hypothetical protein
MKRCPGFLVVILLLGGMLGRADAQEQHFIIGGGGGFATLFNPELDLGRGTNLEGFLGFRVNDQITLEVSVDFTSVTRVFTEAGDVVAETDPAVVGQYQLDQNRYHLDGTFYYHFGRRKPFHPYIFGAGGLVRRENTITTFEGEISKMIEHEPTVSFGTGFDYYVLYNVAVRADIRWWLPGGKTDQRTRRLFFGVGYYF